MTDDDVLHVLHHKSTLVTTDTSETTANGEGRVLEGTGGRVRASRSHRFFAFGQLSDSNQRIVEL